MGATRHLASSELLGEMLGGNVIVAVARIYFRPWGSKSGIQEHGLRQEQQLKLDSPSPRPGPCTCTGEHGLGACHAETRLEGHAGLPKLIHAIVAAVLSPEACPAST